MREAKEFDSRIGAVLTLHQLHLEDIDEDGGILLSIRMRAAAAGLTTAVLLGGAVAVAPAANAVGSSKCNIKDAKPGGVWETSTNNVNLRSGPGTNYSSKGQLSKGTDFTYHCTYKTSDGKNLWYYATVRQGVHKGVAGWISWRYAHLA